MRDVQRFREAARECRRAAGRTQQQLARAIGLHPDVLSHKLHERGGAVLTTAEVTAIVTTLAGWGAIGSRAEAQALLALMAVPPQAISARAWAEPPLAALAPGGPAAPSPPPGAAPGTAGGRVTGGPGRLVPVPLPAPLTPLVGRAAEVAEVAAAVAACRLVPLTGTGGAGKTRVALQAAAGLAGRFTDGVAFADLAPVRDPDLVAVTVARALGLAPRSAVAAEEQLAAALRPARLLLVADNMEHLVEEAPLLGRLLAAAPGLHLLVTSRVPLRLYGEHQLRLPPLRVAERAGEAAACEAVQLFVQRARSVVPGFDPHGEALAATAAICTVLDGLPLAIELAAAWVRLYPPQALLPRLRARPSLLAGGPRDRPERQQTLRATLDWSGALLPSPARDLFARLGVFAGPFDVTAAAAVCAARDSPARMLERLDALAEHSLLEVTAAAIPRFRLLETVREYALARLAETGDSQLAHERHLRHYLTLATEARPGLDGPGQGTLLNRLEADFANISAALHWARAQAETDGAYLEEGLRLATAVAPVWRRRGSLAEGALHLERLLAIGARPGTAAPAIRAWAVLEASALACFRGDYPHSAALAGEGLTLCQTAGDLAGSAWAHRYLGEAAFAVGDLATAEPHFTSQLAFARRARDRWAEAGAHNMLGQVSRYRGSYRQANARLRRALRSFQAAADPDGAASVLNSLGEVARDAGQPARARSLFQQALRGHQLTGSQRGMAADLEGIAATAALDRASRTTLVYLGAAQNLREATGGPLPPAETAVLHRLIDVPLAPLSQRERQDALAEGRDRPLADVIAEALGQPATGTAAAD